MYHTDRLGLGKFGKRLRFFRIYRDYVQCIIRLQNEALVVLKHPSVCEMRQGILQVAYYSFIVRNLWRMRFS